MPARYEAGARSLTRPLKYPWGRALPPGRGSSGNYADSSCNRRLARRFKELFRRLSISAAPVASFRPNGTGLHDLGGNVSEWCHDYYDTFVGSLKKVRRDPRGPAERQISCGPRLELGVTDRSPSCGCPIATIVKRLETIWDSGLPVMSIFRNSGALATIIATIVMLVLVAPAAADAAEKPGSRKTRGNTPAGATGC